MKLVAVLLIVPGWVFYFLYLVRRARDRRDAGESVPHELAEPPGDEDPAVVGVVVGGGRPSGRAVAATVLGLADRKVIDIQEVGGRVRIEVPPGATGASATDDMVLAALAARADDRGDVIGPPIWPDQIEWWRAYAQDARDRAIAAGLVESRIPLVGLMLVTILTATALALVFFWYIVSFIGFILFAYGVPHLIAGRPGYRLSASGVAYRAQWVAFGRYIRAHKSLRDVGPASVTVWGPNLVYGVLVGEGDKAARALTPRVGHDDPAPAELQTEFTTEL